MAFFARTMAKPSGIISPLVYSAPLVAAPAPYTAAFAASPYYGSYVSPYYGSYGAGAHYAALPYGGYHPYTSSSSLWLRR